MLYDPVDILNIDETGIFKKSINNKPFATKNDDRKAIKVDKSRLTLMLCVSYAGKVYEPLVIGKSLNPRCFKNLDVSALGLKYRANETTWLTKELYFECLNNLNQLFKDQNREVLLIVTIFQNIKFQNYLA